MQIELLVMGVVGADLVVVVELVSVVAVEVAIVVLLLEVVVVVVIVMIVSIEVVMVYVLVVAVVVLVFVVVMVAAPVQESVGSFIVKLNSLLKSKPSDLIISYFRCVCERLVHGRCKMG